jgi:hypothetical protein
LKKTATVEFEEFLVQEDYPALARYFEAKKRKEA